MTFSWNLQERGLEINMLHNIKNFWKIILKEKETLFWTFIFPIILGTFFYLTMSNLQSANFIVPANVAVVSDKIDFNNIDEKNKKNEADRKKENEKQIEKAKKLKNKKNEDKLKIKINDISPKKDNFDKNQNKNIKDIFKEKYDKEKIMLDVFSEMSYQQKYIDLENLEDKDIKNLKNEKIKIEEEYKKFKKARDINKEKSKVKDEDDNSEQRLFNIIYVKNEKILKTLLDEEIIVGILRFDEGKPKLEFQKEGIYQTILRSSVSEVYEKITATEKKMDQKSDKIMEDIKKEAMKGKIPTENEIEKRISSEFEDIVNEIVNAKSDFKIIKHNSPDLVSSYYYTLIAMTILYQSIFMIYLTENFIPNRSVRSSRVSVSVTPKISFILAGFFVSFILQLLGIGILILFLKFVVQINVIYDISKFILIIIISTLFSSSFGFFLSNIINKKAGDVQSIAIGFIMMMSMFAGMMSHEFKYAIDKNAPLINKINPAALIVDSIYNSSNLENNTRFYKNIGLLVIIGLILFITGYIFILQTRDKKE